MKKLGILIALLFCGNAFAGTITFDNLTSDSGFSYETYNTPLNTIYNEFNGEIESANIKDGSISGDDMADASNPLVRDNENIGEYVYTGLTLPTSGTIAAATVGAGTAYITDDASDELVRVVMSETSISTQLTDDTTNYIWLTSAGAYVGKTTDASETSAILLGTVTTVGGSVTASDESSRQTVPPSLRNYSDFKNGLVLQRTGAQEITVTRGSIELGQAATNGLRRNTTPVAIDTSAVKQNGMDTGVTQAANTYYYVYAYPDPDNSTNISFLVSTTSADTGASGTLDLGDDQRLIGWVYSATSASLSTDSVGATRHRGGDAPNVVCRTGTSSANITSGTTVEILDLRFNASGNRDIELSFDASGDWNGAGPNFIVSMSMDGVAVKSTEFTHTTLGQLATSHVIRNVAAGPHKFTVVGSAVANTVSLRGETYPQTFIAEEK